MAANVHILVIPYPVQGHVIPLMELSQSLAEHSFKITFLNTEYNHELIIKNSSASKGGTVGDRIHLVAVPDGLQSAEDRKKPGKASEAIFRVMPGKVEELIEQINANDGDKISCIIADQSIGWALEIAAKKGIRRAAFCPAAAALLVLGFSIPRLIQDGIVDEHGSPRKEQVIKLSPSMPAMKTSKFVWVGLGNMDAQKNIFGLMVRNNESIKLTEWLLCNTTNDLEPAALELAPQILAIGPLSLSASNRLRDSKGNFWQEDSTCLQWLDQQQPQSVIYVAFGSFAVFDTTQFQELALGLEFLNRPFLWVVRSDIAKKNDAFLEKFQERVGNCGKIVGWAPQQKVLAHPAVACFVSHCGWNSTMEGVSNGIPFLCWPYFADQFINQSYICEVWQIGLGLERDENGLITGKEIKKKLELVLSNEGYKATLMDLKEMVMNSAKEGGNSHENFKKFVEWLKA